MAAAIGICCHSRVSCACRLRSLRHSSPEGGASGFGERRARTRTCTLRGRGGNRIKANCQHACVKRSKAATRRRDKEAPSLTSKQGEGLLFLWKCNMSCWFHPEDNSRVTSITSEVNHHSEALPSVNVFACKSHAKRIREAELIG